MSYSPPTNMFEALAEDTASAVEVATLINAEIDAQNVTITAQVDGPPVIPAFAELSITPPNPSITARAEQILIAKYQDVGYLDLSYDPGTGDVVLTLRQDFPTNEYILENGSNETTLTKCRC